MRKPRIAITAGEPAGIGPELCAMLSESRHDAELVIVADRELIAGRAAGLGRSEAGPPVFHVPLPRPSNPGALDPANSRYVLETLRIATEGCLVGRFDALVTAPVHKGVINDAGIPFTGHTEYLAEITGAPRVVMMLVGGGMRVALATTHLPLKEVPGALTPDLLEEVLRILHHDLKSRFGIAAPRIFVAGLNPHAGEGGHLGTEEIEVIIPVLDKLRHEGMTLTGPLPADTMFAKRHLTECDAFLAMYHDQGLPVLKHASFGEGINVTLGLPIIRTSVDHGTALDLAGTGTASAGSLHAAVDLAIRLVATSAPGERA